MIVYPNAKINLGLNILNQRDDGYHNIKSIFYPLFNYKDILEINYSKEFRFINTGIPIPGEVNLCELAWRLLKDRFNIENVIIHLHKIIPIGAGLGGGSSDASFTLKALNYLFDLNLSNQELKDYAVILGADCPFFIENSPRIVTGIGDVMNDVSIDLSRYRIKLFYSNIHVSTKEAYQNIIFNESNSSLEDVLRLPVSEWKKYLRNDFEDVIFSRFPRLKETKRRVYENGAIYASMTGTGSAIYGVFER